MKIFYDVDTQNDFMNKNGALYVPDAEIIGVNLAKLTDYAKENFIPVLGSVDRHFGTLEYKKREGELQIWKGPFPNHCMKDTNGELKIYETTLEINRWEDIPDNAHYIPNLLVKKEEILPEFKPYLEIALRKINDIKNKEAKPQGIYFRKQSYDIFANPAFPAFLKMADIKEALVYGVATDYCVKAAVLGMQNKGIQTYVVKDAIKGVEPKTTKQALEEMTNKGAKTITTKQVLEGRFD